MNTNGLFLLIAAFGALQSCAPERDWRAGFATNEGISFSAEELEKLLQHSPLPPPPPDPTNAVADDPGAGELGQALFYDRRLSRSGEVACATCHDPARSFSDGQALPSRFAVDRNTPALWNVAYNRWFFWDGRADSLWAQALQPLENPREHAGHRLQFLWLVRRDPSLRRRYERVFGPLVAVPAAEDPASGTIAVADPGPGIEELWKSLDPASKAAVDAVYANLGKAIAAFERKLVSRRSAFDVFIEGLRTNDAGKLAALPVAAQRGARLFVGKANCRLCHGGPTFSDGEFHNIGVRPALGAPSSSRFSGIVKALGDPFNGLGTHSDDPATGNRKLGFLVQEGDSWGQYKTPTLRNVSTTAPYMHQGQFATLRDVLKYYSTLEGMLEAGHHEKAMLLPLKLSDGEIADLIAFLESLTDRSIDPKLLRAP